MSIFIIIWLNKKLNSKNKVIKSNWIYDTGCELGELTQVDLIYILRNILFFKSN